jgi:hypothetical protein
LKIFRKQIPSALYSLGSGLVKRGVTWHTLAFEKKEVRGCCALPEGDMQKPYVSKCRQGKTKINLFRDFLQKQPNTKL